MKVISENMSQSRTGRAKLTAIRLLRCRRLKPLWMLGVFCYVMFMAFRAILLILSLPKIKTVSFAELWHCFWVGFRFDSMVTGYLLLPLAIVLTFTTAQTFKKLWFRRMITWYTVAVISYVVTFELIGVGYFLHYGQRINWIMPYYLQNPHEVFGYVFKEYPIAWSFFVLYPVSFYLLNRWIQKKFWAGHVPVLPGWKRPAMACGVIFLCVLACRSGFGNRPPNSSVAYEDTHNQLLVELAKNHSYTLFYGTKRLLDDKNSDEPAMFGLMTAKEATPIVQKMLLQENDTLLDDKNPLWRETDTHQPQKDYNVVLIIMESMAGKHVGALGGKYQISQTPNLDALSKKSIFFSNMHAVGSRTCRGMVGTLCGHTDLGWNTILDRKLAIGNFLSLPGYFKARDYSTVFIYGGKPTFDNMGDFFAAAGIDRFIGEKDIKKDLAKRTSTTQPDQKEPLSSWGWADEFIFEKTLETLDKLADKKKKFFSIVLTVSNHPPFTVPNGRVPLLPEDSEENKIINATRYADWALGDFFKQASKTKWFDNTIFVMVADTGRAVTFDKTKFLDAPNYRIPCLIYSPSKIDPRNIDTITSQTDIPPTLLALLGGSFRHCFLGRNALDIPKGQGFALMREDERMAFIQGNGDILAAKPPRSDIRLLQLKDGEFVIKDGEIVELGKDQHKYHKETVRQMQALYEMARYLYEEGIYNDPKKRLAKPATRRAWKGFNYEN